MMERRSRALAGMTLALAVALATAACAGTGSPSPSGAPASPSPVATASPAATPSPVVTPAPTPTPTPVPSPSPTPAPTASPKPPPTKPTAAPTPVLPAFVCGGTVSRKGTVDTARMRGLAVSNASTFGRVVFSFRPVGSKAATPDVLVRPATPPFTLDPSGLPLTVKGSHFVEIVLQGGTALDANLNPTFGGPFDVTLNGSPIVQMKRAGDFEAVSTFIVGLDGPPCVRILPPDGTSSVVIQIKTQ